MSFEALNDINSQALSYLLLACRHREVAEALVAKGCDINLATYHDEATPLMRASERSHGQIVDRLLNLAGLHNFNTQDDQGCSALFLVCQEGYQEVAEALVAKGCDINLAHHDGVTPSMAAIEWGHAQISRLSPYLGRFA